jgi:hypothetical protein
MALEHANLKEFAQIQSDKLEHEITEGGDNIRYFKLFSLDQKIRSNRKLNPV